MIRLIPEENIVVTWWDHVIGHDRTLDDASTLTLDTPWEELEPFT
jgi:hypothetical protein